MSVLCFVSKFTQKGHWDFCYIRSLHKSFLTSVLGAGFSLSLKTSFNKRVNRHRSFAVHFRDLKSDAAHFQQFIGVWIALTIVKAMLYTLIVTLSILFYSIQAQPKKPYYWGKLQTFYAIFVFCQFLQGNAWLQYHAVCTYARMCVYFLPGLKGRGIEFQRHSLHSHRFNSSAVSIRLVPKEYCQALQAAMKLTKANFALQQVERNKYKRVSESPIQQTLFHPLTSPNCKK